MKTLHHWILVGSLTLLATFVAAQQHPAASQAVAGMDL